MFGKLRNKLILINLGVTTIVVLVIFTSVYLIATGSANNRPPIPENQAEVFTDDFTDLIALTIKNEKQAAARDLLLALIFSGVTIEIIVAFISYYLAEEAIKPIREAYESQKVFIANASHEIKTPLAAISANLEAAGIRNNKWITNVEKETTKLTALNNELLTLARTDLVSKTKTEETDLAKIVNENLKTLEPRLAKKSFTKKISITKKKKLNPGDFAQIFNILMDNAIKYCDKKIKLSLAEHELIISNDGTTIPEKDLVHIFDRFYQVDKSSEGVGLGLSIAKSVADKNHWQLIANSNKTCTSFILKY
ncbi:HAMP domain-containing histidine kinase [Candidatus Saccharibacteria bacterium]|nr:HAMP domain-containing histidine kinase [Candidatus Saccharibacteria bacterium]